MTFFHGKYGRRYLNASLFVPLNEVPARLPYVLIVGIIVWLVVYWMKPLTRKTVICTHCNRPKFEDAVTRCDCGRDFEDIKTMKWV